MAFFFVSSHISTRKFENILAELPLIKLVLSKFDFLNHHFFIRFKNLKFEKFVISKKPKIMATSPPIPTNEMERLMALSSYDIDYASVADNFKDLSVLAAKIAGTEISMINLIDSYTQWSIARYGLEIDQLPREESICQYTITQDESFEVADLKADHRFSDKNYVDDPLNLRYYFGIPLTTGDGLNVGSLCVLDTKEKDIAPEKVELLKLIAKEVVNRLATLQEIQDLKNQLNSANETSKRVAHDIRGPLAGIIGLSEIIKEQGNGNQLDEVLDFVNLIHKSSRSILDLADEILAEEKIKMSDFKRHDFNLGIFKEKIEKLYGIQASQKNIQLHVRINPANANIFFSKNKLLQIVGNLISNAIKFTASGGKVDVSLDLIDENEQRTLKILVADNGKGMSPEEVAALLNGNNQSTLGTVGETGYGFGLVMVKHLVQSLKGKMHIESAIGKGTTFSILLPKG